MVLATLADRLPHLTAPIRNRHQIGKEISSVSRRQARRQRKAKAKGADYADRNTSSIACKLSKRKRRQQLK